MHKLSTRRDGIMFISTFELPICSGVASPHALAPSGPNYVRCQFSNESNWCQSKSASLYKVSKRLIQLSSQLDSEKKNSNRSLSILFSS